MLQKKVFCALCHKYSGFKGHEPSCALLKPHAASVLTIFTSIAEPFAIHMYQATKSRIVDFVFCRYKGVTMYQTDWSLAAVTVRLPDSGATPSSSSSSPGQEEVGLLDQLRQQADNPEAAAASSSSSSSNDGASSSGRVFNLPLASLEGRPGVPKGSKLWATFLPLEMPKGDGTAPRGISSKWVCGSCSSCKAHSKQPCTGCMKYCFRVC